MTTNHRPTLESKRGKAESISNTIFHSRSLPQHTSLKYRGDIRKPKVDTKIGKQAVEELKKDLLLNEGKLEDSLKINKSLTDGDHSMDEHISKTIDNQEDERDYNRQEYDERSIGKEEYSGSEDDSGDDSEDETAQLMEELAKIKKERQEEQEKLELQNKLDKTKVSNPLVQVVGASTEANFKIKKSWRDSTAFKKQNSQNKNDDETFTNDTLNSEFHQNFLTKYIR
ncbi:DEHA2E16566p [Debaryomyces hansenii CBS767]|uniref:Pre-mRNA-splicing factor CWC15 n=1 Tax=Debaryomyces hansenii (strain ATCC 36239 / CBS 767 / BCRC 21394 / JCM 1990 / NBRC 0083 / IGC 2968) TaxID=284592 RepID=CWC15_DEBHA|nr:DEHA2E16566p [Debaryomyces hansenii CBS767]Q6BP48.2 RecName: Full=Pre-mRNA-splicing factor CWC15 [Debaryomyces hansenii CBS767]CAR65837.1 DEHA2E16566p [Debaryomyces hansenii CBS767]|eukprot:XP_002770494.1 DEHA2E16566p [Debaryomyces hansenii CBS767]